MFERSLLTDADVDQLSDAVCTVLEKVGALYQNDEILRALDTCGARVDYSRQVATFPRQMVEEFVASLRTEAGPAADDGRRSFAAPGQGKLFHQLCQYYYDSGNGERRLGNREDYIGLLKLGDVLHPSDGVGQCLLLADAPAAIEPLVSTLLQFEYVRQPRGAYVQDVRQVDYLIEMEGLSGSEDLHWLANMGFSSPLRLGSMSPVHPSHGSP